jgi:integrase-like protein
MRSELVVDALQMAVARRRPAPGLIHHSDQGSQYVSLAFGQAARDAGIARSMGSKGDAYDNAVAESFFATLKRNSSTAVPGRHAAPSRPRSSTTSRRSTTASGVTRRLACSRPWSSRTALSCLTVRSFAAPRLRSSHNHRSSPTRPRKPNRVRRTGGTPRSPARASSPRSAGRPPRSTDPRSTPQAPPVLPGRARDPTGHGSSRRAVRETAMGNHRITSSAAAPASRCRAR